MVLNQFYWISLSLAGLLLSLILFSACNEDSSTECFSDSACPPTFLCVNTRCVDSVIESKDPYTLYKDEFHNRLASQCGICHSAILSPQVPSQSESNSEELNRNNMMDIGEVDPFSLPPLSVQNGDSGWRLHINQPTEEQLRQSYEDTLQYINFANPDQSLLLLYGKGEIKINKNDPHPQVYEDKLNQIDPSDSQGGMMNEENLLIDPKLLQDVSFARTLAWTRTLNAPTLLSVEEFTNPLPTLDFNKSPQSLLASTCNGCHNETLQEGGFFFSALVEDAEDLYPFLPLMNFDNPSQSALLLMALGQYDHPPIINADTDQKEGYRYVLQAWIEIVRQRFLTLSQ